MDAWADYCDVVNSWVCMFREYCNEKGVDTSGLSDYWIEGEIMPSINHNPHEIAEKYISENNTQQK